MSRIWQDESETPTEARGRITDRAKLKSHIVMEPKSAVMRQLTDILWSKSLGELADLLMDELTPAERKSQLASYECEEIGRSDGK